MSLVLQEILEDVIKSNRPSFPIASELDVSIIDMTEEQLFQYVEIFWHRQMWVKRNLNALRSFGPSVREHIFRMLNNFELKAYAMFIFKDGKKPAISELRTFTKSYTKLLHACDPIKTDAFLKLATKGYEAETR